MAIIKRILHVRMWLLIMGIAPFIGSLPDLLDLENSVRAAWNSQLTEGTIHIAKAYEIIWATHAMLFGSISIAVALLLSAGARAKYAAIASVAVLLFVAPGFAYSDYGDSNQLASGFLALFVSMHAMVLITGLVHWHDEDKS